MYDIEKYYQAKDVEDAVRALEEDADAVVISGGSDVLIKIREGKLAGCSLVSIHGIPALEGVRMEADGTIVIGPATTFSHITYDPVIQKYIPALGWAVDQVGGPQIRNIGTIGGNVCNGVTSADSAALLFTLNAVLELTGPKGTREIPVAEFYTGPGRTLREHAEILTAIKITRENYQGFYGHYTKYGKRNAMEIATLGCAVHVKLSADNMRISEFRLVIRLCLRTKFDTVRFGKWLIVSLLANVFYLIMLSIMKTNWEMALAAAGMAMGYGIIYSVCQSTALMLAPQGEQGLASSTFFLGVDIGMTLGPVLGGLIDQYLPLKAFYPVMLIIVPIIFLIYLGDRKELNGAVAKH